MIHNLSAFVKGWVPVMMVSILLLSFLHTPAQCAAAVSPFISGETVNKVAGELIKKHGEPHRFRIERGVRQTGFYWMERDGSVEDFKSFCLDSFISDEELREKTFQRFEVNLESLNGHFTEIYRDLNVPIHMDVGPLLAVDQLFGEFSPQAHLQEDLFLGKLAFYVLLNFPVYTLEEKLKLGGSWSRKEWAMARLADRFNGRVPAEVSQKQTQAASRAENYINSYNIFMHCLVTSQGTRPFPEGLKLISHWGLRDELKGQYKNPDGLERQRMIRTVMERIIAQEIPSCVINCADLDWEPVANTVSEKGERKSAQAEPDQRYRHLLEIFRAAKLEDPYSPMFPTAIDRSFKQDREITEEETEKLLVSVMSSKEVARCAKIIQKRLGRPLEDFDIWYNGFKSGKSIAESKLDTLVHDRYPDVAAFQRDLPNTLEKLGFTRERAVFLSNYIVIDPARGAGHAMSAGRRADKSHLRTRFEKSGMNYKGFNIALHELGHCVEQTFSLQTIDHTLLQGVPNTAFTEAFAFVFQARDIDVLGLQAGEGRDVSLEALDSLWSTYEIAGVTTVEVKVWHWLYEHPDADEHQLKAAVISIAKDVWNTYYAPVLGMKNSMLLAVYSHMIDSELYLANYPIGHIIAYQIEEYFKTAPLAPEMERMCRQGALTPEAWMRGAVGDSISTAPLLKAAGRSLDEWEKK